jgi:hypothetical protein
MPTFPPNNLTSALRVLDPHSDKSLDNYLTIQPKPTPEGVGVGVQNDSVETHNRLDRSGESEVVPKTGLYQRGLLKSLMAWAIPFSL